MPHTICIRFVQCGLLAMLVACGHSLGGAYSQGIPVAPRPPAFSPTQDAPHQIGMPGTQPRRVAVEPSPKPTRTLPQTPETMRQPGIWASKEPEADPTITLLGVHMWAPDADEKVVTAYHYCANAANRTKSLDDVPKTQSVRACLAPLIIYKCIQALEHKRPKWIDPGTLAKARKHMSNLSVEPCGGFTEEQLEFYLSAIVNEIAGGM